MSSSSEISEAFAALKADRKIRRSKNSESSLKILTDLAIFFELKNYGTHVIVKHSGKTCDFWPSTGRWIIRGGKNGRGVFQMIKELK